MRAVLALTRFAHNGGVVLGLLGIVILWATVISSLSEERVQALQGARQSTSNLARAFEEHIVRSIKAVDQTLLYMRDSYLRDPKAFDIADWTKRTQALTDMTFQIALIDKDGMLASSNLAATGTRMDLSDREHFRVHRDRIEDTLFISKPVLGRASNKWSIQLTRKLLAADGSFDGVIVISLDPLYLSRFYDSLDLGKGGVVTLVGTDGIIRAHARERAGEGGKPEADHMEAIGRSISGGLLLRDFAAAPEGVYSAVSKLDGIERLSAYRGVRGFPLVVSVGLSKHEVLAAYEDNRRQFVAVASLLTAFLLSVMLWNVNREAGLIRARKQLDESEANRALKSDLLQNTLQHMSQGLLMIDVNRRVQVYNQRALEMLNLPDALMATLPSFDDLLRWQWAHGEFGENGEDVGAETRQFVLSGEISPIAHCYERTRPDGTVLEIRSTPLPDGGVVRTLTDMTLRKETEEVLRRARDQANQAARVRSEFLATMSHEIRSPMSGMVGVIELLRSTHLDAEQAHMAGLIQGAAASLLAVLNDILDFSKIEAGAISINLQATGLRPLLLEVIQPHMLVASAKGVDVRLEIDPEMPAHVESDPLRLRQILNNLLSNAVKFTASGHILVRVEAVRSGAAPLFCVSVSDTGIGMQTDMVARLFEPFMQADGSTTRDFGGTGLGLCISRRLARLLGGDLSATSFSGNGSTFTVKLPLVPAAPIARIEMPAASVSHEGRWSNDHHVLVVDDDFTNRWLTQHQLERLGVRVSVAENGEAALEMLLSRRYDMLLTDCHMPCMDGVALTLAIRRSEDPALQAVPIIGLTADVTEMQRMLCVEAGMTDVVIKPLRLEGLAQILSVYLAKKSNDTIDFEKFENTQIFDSSIYSELFSRGDPEGEGWLLDYLETGRALLKRMQLLMSSGEGGLPSHSQIASAAHQMVGASLSVGAMVVAKQAKCLEREAAEAGPADLYHTLSVLNETFYALETFLVAFIESSKEVLL